jgi:group I intron endonuclease
MIVYLITNKVNGKKYVGQTVQPLKDRWKLHKSRAKHVYKTAICSAIRKYGFSSFSIEVLHECETKEEMGFFEKYYIFFLNTNPPFGYNLTGGGEGTSGWKHTEDAKKKISLAGAKRKQSEEAKEKLRKAHTGKIATPAMLEALDKGREVSLHVRWHQERGVKKEGCLYCQT